MITKLLLCCSKARPYLVDERKMRYHNFVLGDSSVLKSNEKDLVLNGTIVAESDYKIEEITPYKEYTCDDDYNIYFQTNSLYYDDLLNACCMNGQNLEDFLYSKDGNGYAIHIKNLKIYEVKKSFNDYTHYAKDLSDKTGKSCIPLQLNDLPNRPMIVYQNNIRYILLNIKSVELSRVLNNEQTVIVYKNLSKEIRNLQ